MKRRGVSFYVLIVLALAALAGLTVLLAPGSVPDTPAVLLPSAAPDRSSGESAGTLHGGQAVEIGADTVQAALATLSRIDSYSRTLTVQNFWSGGSASSEIDVWVLDDSVRLSVRDSVRDTVKNVLLKGADKWIWYSDSAGIYRGTVRDGDADAYQTLLTYENILTLPGSAILDAGYEDYDGESCIFIRYTDGELGYENRCYISVSTGLLMATETYDGSVLIYSMTSSAPDTSAPDESIFRAP